jgi:sugar phosphate isomerase/epimerase
MDSDPERRTFFHQHLKKVIKGANLLGLHNVNTFVGRDQNKNLMDSIEDFKKIWPDIVKYAEDNDVKIGVESCPMYFTMDEWPAGKNLAGSPRIWREIFEIIDSRNFGLNYDPSHLIWQRMNYIRPIYEFKDKIMHMHIKDAQLYQDKLDDVGPLATPLEYHCPKIPGLGDINWGKVVSAMRDIRYKGAVCIEVEDYSFEDSIEGRLLAIRQSKAYMNQYIL